MKTLALPLAVLTILVSLAAFAATSLTANAADQKWLTQKVQMVKEIRRLHDMNVRFISCFKVAKVMAPKEHAECETVRGAYFAELQKDDVLLQTQLTCAEQSPTPAAFRDCQARLAK